MINYVNADDKYVGSVIVYEHYDDDTGEFEGYYKDEAYTEKLTVDEAVEIFLHSNLVVAHNGGEEEDMGYFKALSLITHIEDDGDEPTRTFEIVVNRGEATVFIPKPKAEDAGKVLTVVEKEGEYIAGWKTPEAVSEG